MSTKGNTNEIVDEPTNDKAVQNLNKYLETRSYIIGYNATQADATVFNALSGFEFQEQRNPNVVRWRNHIASFNEDERASWPEAAFAFGQAVASAGASSSSANDDEDDDEDDDDDDFDVFGEDEDAAAALEAEKKDKKKPKAPVIGKSSVIFFVKPWDDTTDMKAMEAGVRAITMDGLTWSEKSELVGIGYGISKLQIGCTVVDDLVSVDDLEDAIRELEDYVQSVDIASFNKL